ncbi:ABC transporter permease [Paenibacillus macerans]|uniref:ABC transporter permease n=1 Tax=Paenibacillus macerans TaxID=44252 RepID=UPI003D312857
MSLLHYLVRNIWHRKFLSLLTMLSVAATVAFIVLLSLSRDSVEQGAEKGYGPFDLVVGAAGSETQLVLSTFYHVGAPVGNIPLATLDTVRQDSGVDTAYAMTAGDNYNGYPIVGIDPAYFLTRYGDRMLATGKLYAETGEVAVGDYVARTLGLQVGDTFSGAHGLIEGAHHETEGAEAEHGEHDEHESFMYTVRGILPRLNTPDDRAVFTTVDYAWAVHGEAEAEREITSILVKPRTLLGAQQLKNNLEEAGGVQVTYTSKAVADVVNLVDRGAEIVGIVTLLCVVLAAISILLSLIAAAGERTKDVGLLRLLGKSKGYVWMTMIGEGLLITAAGLVLGLLAGHVGSYLLKDALFAFGGIQIEPFRWSQEHTLIAAGTLLIGLAASLGPALRLYRMDPLTLFKS